MIIPALNIVSRALEKQNMLKRESDVLNIPVSTFARVLNYKMYRLDICHAYFMNEAI